MMRPSMREIVWMWAAATLLGGCVKKSTPYVYPDDLTHANYVRRTKAVRHFARNPDPADLDRIFDRLLDPEAQIRAIAYESITALMPAGEDFGYRPYLSEGTRVGIVRRWRRWWFEERGQDDGCAADGEGKSGEGRGEEKPDG